MVLHSGSQQMLFRWMKSAQSCWDSQVSGGWGEEGLLCVALAPPYTSLCLTLKPCPRYTWHNAQHILGEEVWWHFDVWVYCWKACTCTTPSYSCINIIPARNQISVSNIALINDSLTVMQPPLYLSISLSLCKDILFCNLSDKHCYPKECRHHYLWQRQHLCRLHSVNEAWSRDHNLIPLLIGW